jgi:hypothetical protein
MYLYPYLKISSISERVEAKGKKDLQVTCGLYYEHITIVNDDSNVVNKFEASLTDDAKVIIYDRHMFIVQATGIVLQNFFKALR